MTRLDPLWLRVYRDVGGDRYLSHAELPAEAAAATRTIWEIYDRLFGRFTGAGLDPLFHRFAHPPARRLAAPAFPRGVPMVIAGAGASLESSIDELRRIRDRVLLVSSWRGALTLQSHGMHADLVLVEQPNVFDAQAAADDRRFSEPARLHPFTKVLAQPAAPPDLLKDLDADACRLATGLPTWGLWPATMTALALEANVPAIGLVLDPPQPPLLALLELLAQAAPGACRDCVAGTPAKRGWTRTSLQSFAEIWAAQPSNVQELTWRHERPNALLLEEARHDLATMRTLLPDAHEALAVALQARAGNVPRDRSLTRAIELMLAWGADPHLRTVLQRGLGLSFLPRFWRTGIRIGHDPQLWRPLVLALHELTTQADRLIALVDPSAGEPDVPVPPSASAHPPSPSPPPARPSEPSDEEPSKKFAEGESGRPGRVSVLMPLKNGLPHLHDAMASLIAQTYPDLEILVIDDGSEDGGPEEIQGRALSHVRVVPSNGQGIAAALNTGLKLATGEFIARHDADDWSHPERIERQIEYLSRHPDIDVLATCAEFVDVEGRPAENTWTSTVRRHDDAVQTPEALARLLPRSCALHHGTVMARRDVLRAAGGYRSAFVCAQEYDLSLRLLPEARFAKLPQRLYTYRLHERQTTLKQQDQQRRALIRSKLEYVIRREPKLAAGARLVLAADARGAEVHREVGREIGLTFEDDMLPASPDPSGTLAAPLRDLLSAADGLVIAEPVHVNAWIDALTIAGGPTWIEIGVCLIRQNA
jgi:glycosyltransferase involved in cell wall biosynthesis